MDRRSSCKQSIRYILARFRLITTTKILDNCRLILSRVDFSFCVRCSPDLDASSSSNSSSSGCNVVAAFTAVVVAAATVLTKEVVIVTAAVAVAVAIVVLVV